ncbi:MAG: MFS transporter [Alphaproteobacteria bacterium]|nr:MFS transporter [Alphaproteobacteria bacterium]
MSRKDDGPGRAFVPAQWNAIYLLGAAGALVAALIVGIQPLLLDTVFGIAFEKEGSINADVQVVAEIVSIITVGLAGLTSDRIGRVPVIAIAFLAVCFGAFLSLVSLDTAPTLGAGALVLFYLVRALITSGAETAQLQLATLVGDASEFGNRPRLIRNIVLMTVFGGTVLAAIVIQIAKQPGGIAVILTLPLLVGLFGFFMARRMLTDVAPRLQGDEHLLRKVWALVSRDPRMQLALVAAFYTRADVVITSLFFSLWCISVSDLLGMTRTAAAAHAAVMIGLLGFAVLVAIPFWKVVIERHSRISAIGASLSLAGMGYGVLGMFANPFNGFVALPLLLIGVGHAGCTVTLNVLTVDISPKRILGSMLGTVYLIGGVGIIMMVQSSGYYFDAAGPRAPFLLMATGKFLVTLYAGWLLLNGINETAAHSLTGGRKIDWKPLVFMTAALPFVWLIGRVLTGGYITNGSLTEAPVGFINRYLGDWAITFLLISLAIRPVQELTGIKVLARYRRMIGLYAFFYALMHVIAYPALEWAFNVHDMLGDIVKRPFILLGILAFIPMTALAVTSTDRQIRRLGGKRWKKLHQAVYAIGILAALHFIFAANHENGEPYVYAVIIAALLAYRVAGWRKKAPG